MNEKMLKILDSHEKFMYDKYANGLLLAYGPGHVVFDDYDLEDSAIFLSIETIDKLLENPTTGNKLAPSFFYEYRKDMIVNILNDTKRILVSLLEIPEDERYVYEEDEEED